MLGPKVVLLAEEGPPGEMLATPYLPKASGIIGKGLKMAG